MGIRDWFQRDQPATVARVEPTLTTAEPSPAPRAMAGQQFSSLNDPGFLEFIRAGSTTVTSAMALRNTAVKRSVDLISGVIGSLPLSLKEIGSDGSRTDAISSEVHKLLRYRPNHYQTPMQFKRLMQVRALIKGASYARIAWSTGRPIALIPITGEVKVEQRDDLTPFYRVTSKTGKVTELEPKDMFVLDALSLDGATGLSPVELAAEVISTAIQAQKAADRIFQTGMMAGGRLSHKGKLSAEAHERLRAQMAEFTGSQNAGRWMIMEEGMDGGPWDTTAQEGQLVETRAAQVEEIARVFGMPRPLLMMDDTSWGSGIEALAILFVRFTLSPWFVLWEEQIKLKLIRPEDWGRYEPDFDERELLRGTLKEQGEFFAKALGSGGHMPWMEANEVRQLSGLGAREDGKGLKQAGGKANDTTKNPGA